MPNPSARPLTRKNSGRATNDWLSSKVAGGIREKVSFWRIVWTAKIAAEARTTRSPASIPAFPPKDDDRTQPTPIAADARPIQPRRPIRSPRIDHARGATNNGWTLMKIDDLPAALRLVPQLNEPICAAVIAPWPSRSHQNRGLTATGWPTIRQTRTSTGRLRRNRNPATPNGGTSGVANFTATALPPQKAQQAIIASRPGPSSRLVGVSWSMEGARGSESREGRRAGLSRGRGRESTGEGGRLQHGGQRAQSDTKEVDHGILCHFVPFVLRVESPLPRFHFPFFSFPLLSASANTASGSSLKRSLQPEQHT